jgi:putative superfamily III holin-X
VTSSASPAPKPTPRPAQSAPDASLTKKPVADRAAPSTNGKHAAEASLGQLVSDASTHMSTLLRSEIELAKLELRATVKNAGAGAGLFAAAGVILVFSLTFGFFALAEGLAAAGLWRWAAFLVVFGMQLIAVALCVYLGVKKVRRVRAPEQTIRTTKETVDYLKKSRE